MRKTPLTPWAKEVKKTLIDRDMEINDLVRGTGLNRTYISGVLNSHYYLPEVAAKITDFLGIKVEYGPASR